MHNKAVTWCKTSWLLVSRCKENNLLSSDTPEWISSCRCISNLQLDVVCPAMFRTPNRSCQIILVSVLLTKFLILTHPSPTGYTKPWNSAYSQLAVLDMHLLSCFYLLFQICFHQVEASCVLLWSSAAYHWSFASLPKLVWIATFPTLFPIFIAPLWCSPLKTNSRLCDPLAQGKIHRGTKGHLVHKWRQLAVRWWYLEWTAEKSWRICGSGGQGARVGHSLCCDRGRSVSICPESRKSGD